MNKHMQVLKEIYKNEITADKKSSIEILQHFNGILDFEDISKCPSVLSTEKSLFKINCIYAYDNERLNLSIEELDVYCYILQRNSKSEKYFQSINDNIGDSVIYFFIETKTGYIDSNCNILYLELIKYRGVSETDINSNSLNYNYYLRIYHEYKRYLESEIFLDK